MTKPVSIFAMFIIAAMALLIGCETAPTSPERRDALHDEVQATLTRMKERDPSLDELLRNSHGYVVFPSVGKGGLIVGGAFGRGEVYERGQLIGYADITEASVGLQAGGQEYAELIVFQTENALNRLRTGTFQFGTDVSAVALKAGAAASATFNEGVAVITMPKGGLMAAANVSGQRLTFQPLNMEPPARSTTPQPSGR